MSPRRTWLLAWLAGPLIGIANGTLRELAYKDRVGERTAHQLSTGSAIALFAAYFELLARLRPLTSARDALQVGFVWLALTVAFEFGFGRAIAHTSWDELLADYDLRKGRLWPLVLAWIALGPAIVRARRCGKAAMPDGQSAGDERTSIRGAARHRDASGCRRRCLGAMREIRIRDRTSADGAASDR